MPREAGRTRVRTEMRRVSERTGKRLFATNGSATIRYTLVTSLPRALLALALACSPVLASRSSEHPAQALVEEAVERVLDVLDERAADLAADLAADRDLLERSIDEYVTPYVDVETMIRLAVGKHWRRADATQRIELIEEFEALLMNTYAVALEEYEDASVRFEPFRPGSRDDRAVVRSVFRQRGTGEVPVVYRLRDKGGWHIYDIEVNGISLVTSYRAAFADEIERGGIEGLLATLRARNRSSRPTR